MSTDGVPPTDTTPEPAKPGQGVTAEAASRAPVAVLLVGSVLAPAWWWWLRTLVRQGDAQCLVGDPVMTQQGVITDCVTMWPLLGTMTAGAVVTLWISTIVSMRRAVGDRADARRAARR